MGIEQLEEKLKLFQKTQDPYQLLGNIFDLLSNNPSLDEQDLLELWLMTYSFEDTNRVVQYWSSQLDTGSRVRQKKATTFLTVLAKTNINARNVLKKFLEEVNIDTDPSWVNLKTRLDDLDNS